MMKLNDRIDSIQSRINSKKLKVQSLNKDIERLNNSLLYWKKRSDKNNFCNKK